jgi:hypothetical protein
MRKSSRRMRNVIIGLFVLLGLLILALFGVSYAAAILARQIITSSSANPALTNNAGKTVRTAGAMIPVNTTIPVSNSGRLLMSHEYNEGDIHHRRMMATSVDAHGRTLQVAAPVDNTLMPAPLAKQMTLKAEIAIQICTFVAENNIAISMMFDPYQEGVGFVTATFKPETMNGCNDLSSPFGFNSDFEVTFKTGLAPTYWHIDCVGPIVPGGICTVSRVFLIPQQPDITMANNMDQTAPPQPRQPLPTNTTVGGAGRLLSPGKWGSAVDVSSQTWDSSKCPRSDWSNIPTTSNSPSNSGQSDSIMSSVLAALPVDPTASPKDQAIQACMSSALCAVGFLVCSGMVFQASFWQTAGSLATAMGQSFTQTMSPTNMRNFWNSFSGSRSTRCTTTYTWAVCGMNKLPTYTGNGQYTCSSWNTGDITAGAKDIMSRCANSCEVLQWYYSWWQNYRVGSYSTTVSSYPYTNTNKPAWYDGNNYRYSQDWCGAADSYPCDRFYDSTYCGAGTGTYNGYHLLQSGASNVISGSGYSYATHPRCWGGNKIPLCTSAKIVLSSTC